MRHQLITIDHILSFFSARPQQIFSGDTLRTPPPSEFCLKIRFIMCGNKTSCQLFVN